MRSKRGKSHLPFTKSYIREKKDRREPGLTGCVSQDSLCLGYSSLGEVLGAEGGVSQLLALCLSLGKLVPESLGRALRQLKPANKSQPVL